MLVLIALFGSVVRATQPSCAILFAGTGDTCSGRQATIWVDAALDEAVRYFSTANGGFLEPACTGDPAPLLVLPFPVPYTDLLCFDRYDIPQERCHTAQCNYDSHPELFTSDCDDLAAASDDGDGRHAACRSIESWSRIASEKLALAMDLLEQEKFDLALSNACAAELIFAHINKWLYDTTPNADQKLLFISPEARETQRYTNIVGALRNGVFPQQTLEFRMRAVQSARHCHTSGRRRRKRNVLPAALLPGEPVDDAVLAERVTSALMFTSFNGTGQTVIGTAQLAWAAAGIVTPFASTFRPFDPSLACVKRNPATNLDPIDPTRIFEPATAQDFADVRFDGTTRTYTALVASSTCPLAVLLHDVRSDRLSTSVTQWQFARPPLAQQPDVFAQSIEAGILLRVATDDDCVDEAPAVWTDAYATVEPPTDGTGTLGFSATYRAPPAGVPLTLAPDESRCVGGDRAGERCTVRSECGAGRACRRKPFAPRSVAYCYDGTDWDERRPCAFADDDEQCPFGECVGEVSNLVGGAYPLLHFYQQNDCHRADSDSPVCAEPHVAAWFQYPNTRAFE